MNNYSLLHKNNSETNWLKDQFLEKKLNTVLGYFILSLLAIGCAYCTTLIDIKTGVLYLGVFVVIFIVVLFIRNPYFGLFFTIIFSSLPSFSRIMPSTDFAFGSVTDVLAYLVFSASLLNINTGAS